MKLLQQEEGEAGPGLRKEGEKLAFKTYFQCGKKDLDSNILDSTKFCTLNM